MLDASDAEVRRPGKLKVFCKRTNVGKFDNLHVGTDFI